MMAHAYTEPATAPAAPNPLMPAFLTMVGCMARLTAELDTMRARVCAERAYMRRPDIEPADKVIGLLTAWELGFAPDSPNPDRPREWAPMRRGKVAEFANVGPDRVGASWQAMGQAGWYRRNSRYETKDETAARLAGLAEQRTRKGLPPQEPTPQDLKPHKIVLLAPPEGSDWVDTWANPATLPPLLKPERLQRDAEQQADKAKENRATLAEAQRIVETMTCDACGKEGADLYAVCRHCGAFTSVKTLVGDQNDESAQYKSEEQSGYVARAESTLPDGQTAPPPLVGDQNDESALPDFPVLDAQEALAAAASVLYDAIGHNATYLEMLPRQIPDKYITRKAPPVCAAVTAHLRGAVTLGAGLYWLDAATGERRTRVLALDADAKYPDAFCQMLRGATRLARAGLPSLVVRNATQEGSGHLWVFLDEPIEPARGFAALYHLAPELKDVPECFPNPKSSDGGRLRLPCGVYHPKNGSPVPVLVALATASGRDLEWRDGATPEAWTLIPAAVSPAGILETTWLPPDQRPAPPVVPVRRAAPIPVAETHPGQNGGESLEEIIDRFNAQHPVDALITANAHGYFSSPWRQERTPSAKVYDNNTWTDYSQGSRRGGDALALWCALHNYWPEGAEKPDRLGALRHLGLLPARCTLTVGADATLVRWRIFDRDEWTATKHAFCAAFPSARFQAEAKAWAVLPNLREAVMRWHQDRLGAAAVTITELL